MTKYICELCGTDLVRVDGKFICPNHGIRKEEINESEETKRNYIN